MKKKFTLLITLALSAFIATGCTSLDNFFGGKEVTSANNENQSSDSQEQSGGEQQPDDSGTPTKTYYYVNYDANGGEGSMHRDKVTRDEYEIRACEFERSGFDFYAWGLNSPEGDTYQPGEKLANITADITLYALWTENNPQTNYTVSFNANGGTGTMANQQTNGSTYIVPACVFTRESYTFNGWALGSASGQKYSVGASISNISTDIVLYALWEAIPVPVNYTVSFNANGGTGTMADQQTNGSTYVVPACEFTKTDYTFKEWALNSVSGTRYSTGSNITGISSSITLYAIWKSNTSSGDFDGYYDDIDDSLSGATLLAALNALNTSKRKSTVGYAGMRYFAPISDADPDGSGKIIGFYDNKKVGPDWDSGSTWNREHVWPNVRGGSKVEGDAHMTRPASTSTNGDRGSKGFGKQSYDPGQFVAYYRGVASRIIFYAAIADTTLGLIDDPLNYNGCSSEHTNKMGCLSDMLEWNLQYLPSDTSFTGSDDVARRTELNRNEVIQNHINGQGNRNPFIDHPEYACKIWGTTNSKTRTICGM